MNGFVALLVFCQLPTAQQAYDEMRAILDKAQGVSFDTNRVQADAWEGEMGVSARRPGIYSISGLGQHVQCDGTWRYETGNGGTYLRKLKSGDGQGGYIGFESFFQPEVKPILVGDLTEITAPWRQNLKTWRILLRFPDAKEVALFLDPATKLPAGYSWSNHRTYYYKNVQTYNDLQPSTLNLGPPSLSQLLAKTKHALGSHQRAAFWLSYDSGKAGKPVALKRGVGGRFSGLYGWEEFLSQRSVVKMKSQPEFTVFNQDDVPAVWKVVCTLPKSPNTLELYFDRETWLPAGFQIRANETILRTGIYTAVTLSK